jgi:L-histidine N-alpha-methyltransferase
MKGDTALNAVTTNETIRIDSYLCGDSLESIADDVREGLSRDFKEIAPKYFYDERGSQLFDRITSLPEYYPTRCEREILNRWAPQIVALSEAEELVELGSGTASKTRALLFAMAGTGRLRRYVPMDCSESVVVECADQLSELYPGLEVHGVVGDFERHLEHLPDGERRLFAFLGGTIGNFYPEARSRFLSYLRTLMGPTDHLLLGTDLVKDVDVLEAAYNDSAGVTADFNLNVLRVINQELDADFDLDAFEHLAFFDPDACWIEMRLRSLREQDVRVDGTVVHFGAGEEIRTEISAKFTREQLAEEFDATGLAIEAFFTDPGGRFALTLAGPQ